MSRTQAAFFGILLLISLFSRTFSSQTYPFKLYTTADGLVQATVEKVFQDSRGFLWFGTRGGASRYDGNEFINYLSEGILRSDVKDIWEDDDHTLWLVTYGKGIAKVNLTDTTVTWMKSVDTILPDDYVNVVFRDSQKRVWIGTERGVVLLNSDGSWVRFDARSGLPHDMIHTVVEDPEGYVWLGTQAGLLRCRINSRGEFEHETILNRPTRSLLVGRNGHVFATTTGGVDNLQGGVFEMRGKFVDTLISYSTIHEVFKGLCLCEDSYGTIWVGTSRGIWLLHNGVARRLRGEHGLPNEYVYDIMEDREGTIWIGTENGVSKLPARNLVTFTVSRGSPSDVTLAMFQDSRRNFWFGSYLGLMRLDPDERMTFFDERDGLLDPLVNSISQDEHGEMWIGTKGGLNLFSNGRLVLKQTPFRRDHLSVSSVVRDRHGAMWIGGYGFIIHFRHEGSPELIDAQEGLPPGPVRSLTFDREGTLWFGTDESGAGYYSNDTLHILTVQQGLPDNRVHCVFPDRSGRIWFATENGVAFFRHGHVWPIQVSEPAIQSGPVYFVLEDSTRQLWFGTQYGVYAWAETLRQHLSTQDGLAADIVERGLVDTHGNIWFGTHAGVSRLNKINVGKDIPIPFVYVERVNAGDDEQALVDGSRVDYADRTLVFLFNALSYVDERNLRFQWAMEGFDRTWLTPQIQRRVRYTNLDPGSYTFVVRAANRNGPWSRPARFSFIVLQPFWQTWWFMTLTVLFVGSLVTLVYRYRVTQLLKVERMRTSIAADLHDDIASSLSSVALYSDVLQRELKNVPGDAPALLSRIGVLSREVMGNIGLIVWAVDPRRDELTEVFQYFQRHAAQLCSAAGISFVAQLPDDMKSVILTPDQRRTVFLILKEALNNTLKHASCSRIVYTCRLMDRMMEMTLQDDGKGFSPGDHPQGHGLQNISARASAIGANVTIDSSPGRGTALRLTMRMA